MTSADSLKVISPDSSAQHADMEEREEEREGSLSLLPSPSSLHCLSDKEHQSSGPSVVNGVREQLKLLYKPALELICR